MEIRTTTCVNYFFSLLVFSFSHAAEASGGRKEEGCEQLAARTRRARGCRFEQASQHVPRVGQGHCRLRAACRWPAPTSNVVNRRPSSRRFQIFDFFSLGRDCHCCQRTDECDAESHHQSSCAISPGNILAAPDHVFSSVGRLWNREKEC